MYSRLSLDAERTAGEREEYEHETRRFETCANNTLFEVLASLAGSQLEGQTASVSQKTTLWNYSSVTSAQAACAGCPSLFQGRHRRVLPGMSKR